MLFIYFLLYIMYVILKESSVYEYFKICKYFSMEIIIAKVELTIYIPIVFGF